MDRTEHKGRGSIVGNVVVITYDVCINYLHYRQAAESVLSSPAR
jgi:hypothetical protein